MPTTPNKGFEVQVTGSNSGTWGDVLNDDVISIQDSNLGGIVTKSVAGSNITLTGDEPQNVIIRLTGAQSADIQVTNPCVGFYFVENLTTNAFAITMTNGVTGVVVPKGRSTVIADTTNGCRIASADSIPSGTPMLFKQTAAPTGWTKVTSDNDKAIRIVSGTASTGGSVAFSTAFATPATVTSIGATTLTESQIPSHYHLLSTTATSTASKVDLSSANSISLQANNGNGDYSYFLQSATPTLAPTIGRSSLTGGDASHTHTATGTATINVQYVDFIVATRN